MVVAAFGSAASPSHPVLTARCLWSRSYLDTMARTGTWVEGEAEMLAAACVFNLKIEVAWLRRGSQQLDCYECAEHGDGPRPHCTLRQGRSWSLSGTALQIC